MNDMASAPVAPATTSTTLDPGASGPSAAGGGAPSKVPDAEPSLHDSIAAAVKQSTIPEKEESPVDADKKPDPKADADKGEAKAKEGAEKAPEKADAEPKAGDAKEGQKTAERAADGKFTAKQPEGETDDTPKGREKQIADGMRDAPAKFLPDAKERWANVPREVRRDIETMTREHETEITRYREASERYESIRQYDDMARQSGRAGVHESLREVAELEDMMGKNPLAALNQILLRAGPRKPDGSPVSLFEVAQTIVQMGQQGYNQAVTRAQQQSPQNDNSEVTALRQQMAQIQQQQLAATIIEPFKRDHPRYEELQGDIALFLKSGKIPTSLSPHERLGAAYDMAVRVNPASTIAPEPDAGPVPGDRAVEDLSGSKSIKSAPGAVSDDLEPERGGSIREELERAVRRSRLA